MALQIALDNSAYLVSTGTKSALIRSRRTLCAQHALSQCALLKSVVDPGIQAAVHKSGPLQHNVDGAACHHCCGMGVVHDKVPLIAIQRTVNFLGFHRRMPDAPTASAEEYAGGGGLGERPWWKTSKELTIDYAIVRARPFVF